MKDYGIVHISHRYPGGFGNKIEIRTEENIQGGISKIQSADNVIALIPNSKSREVDAIRAKILKSRDSAGVGNYVDFHTKWPTLTFEPWIKDDDDDNIKSSDNAHSNLPSQKGRNEKEFKRRSEIVDNASKVPESDINETPSSKTTASVIRSIKTKKPHKKIIKLL